MPRPENKNNGPPDDPVLLEAALRGDIEAFASLFERYRPSLRAVCLKQLGDPSLVEDVVQEVFIRAFMSLPNYQHRNLFRQWLATIATRMCIDLQRRRSFIHYTGDIGPSVDADAGNGTSEKKTESALDAVIASEEQAEFWESLKVLTKSQRRAFVLYAVDGWSCADIAVAEGISVDAVKHLLFRARRKMRATRQSGLPALVFFPSTWMRSRLQEAEERIRILLGAFGERLSSTGALAMSLGMLVVIAVTVNDPAGPSMDGDLIPPDERVTATGAISPLQNSFLDPNVSPSARTPGDSDQFVTETTGSLIDDFLNPNQNVTPENTSLHSITASPNYESDHTILAVGYSPSTKYVLFVSHDGGGTWKPKPSRLLEGSIIVLPPSFPADGRIFAFGGVGLQQSDDGGEIFRTVSPVLGHAIAISPSFGKGDSKILMGGTTLWEFDASTGLTQPAPLAITPALRGRPYFRIAFSQSYPSDSTVFVSSAPYLYSCKGLICDETVPARNGGDLTFRFSPRCSEVGATYAFTPWTILVSRNGAQTFEEVPLPLKYQPSFGEGRSISDIAVFCSASSDPTILASLMDTSSDPMDNSSDYPRFPAGVFRSIDAGRSWSKTSIGGPSFGYGSKLLVTPSGRFLSAGWGYGIACSEDGGVTWVPRCTPEP